MADSERGKPIPRGGYDSGSVNPSPESVPARPSRLPRFSFEVALGLALAAGLVVAAGLLVCTWPLSRLPSWDAAGNGQGAVELWTALASGNPIDFLLRLNAQDKWPFGFSLLLLPFVAADGVSFESATLLPALAFALVPGLLVWAGWEMDRDGRGLASGLLAGALWLASPLPRALATVVMRETTGAALGIAVLAAYLRARRLGGLRAWRLAAGLGLGLFFVKYNYFLLSGGALGLHALLEATGEERRAGWGRLRGAVVDGGWRSPWRWVAVVMAVAFVSQLVGQNPGNFLYAALLIATIVMLSLQWRALSRPGATLDRLPPAVRAGVEWLVAPLWIWSLSPRPVHPRNVIAFLTNRPGEQAALSPAALAAYPKAFFAEVLPPGPAGWLVAALALAGLALLLRRGDPGRALAATFLVGFCALELHPLKESRFLVTVAPTFLLIAALVTVRGAARLLPGRSSWRTGLGLPVLLLSIYGVLSAAASGGALARLERDHENLTASPALLPVLTEAANRVATGPPRVGLLGGLNEVSESLVRWEVARGYGGERTWADPLRGLDGASPPAEIERRLARWLDREAPDRVVALRPMPGSRWLADGDYLRWNAWQVAAIARLGEDPAWRLASRWNGGALGLEVLAFERVGASAALPAGGPVASVPGTP